MKGLRGSDRVGSRVGSARLAAAAIAIAWIGAWTAPATAARDASDGPAPARRSVQRIAPGLTLTKISRTAGPDEIRVLTVDPSKGPTIDVGLAGGELGHYERTSSQAKRAGALGAVNGDFARWPGRPVHALQRDGRFVTAGIHRGALVAVSADERRGFAGPAAMELTAKLGATGHSFRIAEWNSGDPRGDRVAAFTTLGGKTVRPPTDACSARLLPRGELRWGSNEVGLRREYRVDVARCRHKAMSLGGGVVLASKQHGGGADELRSLSSRDSVTLGWSTGWPGVLDAIGGAPHLVRNGNNVVPNRCTVSLCYRQPRTAAGITADGKILLVTVDGRRANWSIGFTLDALAREMIALGAVDAVNLDGGGGATMWVRGKGLVNRPADPDGERPANTTVLVLPGRDRGEPVPRAPERLTRSSEALAAAREAQRDPGSTGGLLDAHASGQFDPNG